RACFGRRALPHPPAPRERRRRAPARTREQRLARPGPRPPRTHALKKDGKREKEKGRRKAGSWKLKTNEIHTTPGPRADSGAGCRAPADRDAPRVRASRSAQRRRSRAWAVAGSSAEPAITA